MAFALKDGQGTLFKNDKKGNDKAPDYRGELMVNGALLKVAGWIKDGKNGKWMSLKAEPPNDTRAAAPGAKLPADDGDEPVPF